MVGSYNGPYIVNSYDSYPSSSSLYSGSYNTTTNYLEQPPPTTTTTEYIDPQQQQQQYYAYGEYDVTGRTRFPSQSPTSPLDFGGMYDGFVFQQQQYNKQQQGII